MARAREAFVSMRPEHFHSGNEEGEVEKDPQIGGFNEAGAFSLR